MPFPVREFRVVGLKQGCLSGRARPLPSRVFQCDPSSGSAGASPARFLQEEACELDGDYDSSDHQAKEARIEIITQKTEDMDGHVEVLICDTGCGISEDMQDKIFDPFFTTKEVGKGTGLGLSISYGIIKEHDADIEVKDTGLHGTSMCIRFPMADQ